MLPILSQILQFWQIICVSYIFLPSWQAKKKLTAFRNHYYYKKNKKL